MGIGEATATEVEKKIMKPTSVEENMNDQRIGRDTCLRRALEETAATDDVGGEVSQEETYGGEVAGGKAAASVG
jgi:hypothetical protein